MQLALDSVEFENFGPYKKKQKLKFGLGYTTFIGENGSGKTWLGMVIPWILTGAKGLGLTESDVCPLGTSLSPKGRAIFKKDDGGTVEVMRASSTASFIEDGETLARTKTGVAEKIEDVMKINAATIGATNYVAQNELQNTISRKADIRIKTVESILGTENFKNIDSAYNRMVKKDRGVVENYDPSRFFEAKAVADLEASRNKKGKADFRQKKKELKATGIDGLKSKRQESLEITSRFYDLEDDLDSVVDIMKTMATQYRNKKEIVQDQLTELKQANKEIQDIGPITNLTFQKTKEKDVQRQLDIASEKFTSLARVLSAKSESYHNLESSIQLESKPSQTYDPELREAVENRYNVLRDKYYLLVAEVESSRMSLDALESDGSSCARCGTELTEDHHSHMIETLANAEKELIKVNKELSMSSDRLAELKRIQIAWADFKIRKSSNKEVRDELKKVSTEVEEMKKKEVYLSERRDHLRNTLTEIIKENSSQESKNCLADTLKRRINSCVGRLDTAKKEKKLINQKLKDYNKQRLKVGDQLRAKRLEHEEHEIRLVELDSRIRANEAKIATIKSSLRLMGEEIEISDRNLSEAHAKLDSLKRKHTEYEDSKDYLSKIKKARVIIRKFRQNYQAKIRPVIERITNQVFMSVSKNDFESIVIDEDYNIAGVKKDGTKVPSNLFSGAQKDTLALAFRVALARLKQQVSSNPMSLMILDEPNASFDSDRVDSFIETLNRMRKLVPQVLCITHDEKLKKADKTFSVSMSDEGSEIS